MIAVDLNLVQLDWNRRKKLKIGAVSWKLFLLKRNRPQHFEAHIYTEHYFLTLYPRNRAEQLILSCSFCPVNVQQLVLTMIILSILKPTSVTFPKVCCECASLSTELLVDMIYPQIFGCPREHSQNLNSK